MPGARSRRPACLPYYALYVGPDRLEADPRMVMEVHMRPYACIYTLVKTVQHEHLQIRAYTQKRARVWNACLYRILDSAILMVKTAEDRP
jgi:hypothetical protein